jgi:excisionase family DNA binding protein
MHTLTQHSGQSEGGRSPQESLKTLLKTLMEGAVGLAAGRAGDTSAVGVRKGKASSTGNQVLAITAITQETVDAIAGLVAKTLADVSNQQVALTRAMLAAALAELSVNALQGKSLAAPLRRAIADDTELTTEEAAKLLFVSRPYLVKLLDTNIIPLAQVTVGGQRRVRKEDVLRYKALLRFRQENAMRELAKATDELAPYEVPPTKARGRKR